MIKKSLLLVALAIISLRTAAQTTVLDSFIVDGVYRSFRLYIPAAFNSTTRPLVLNMHGLGSNAFEQQYYGNFMPIADTAGFYVVMPQGLSFAGTTFWNVGFPGTPNVDDVKFLSTLIDTLAKRYPVDKSRVYATGMSNGGYMSHILGIRLSNKVAAIASVAGSIVPDVYSTLSVGKAVPVMQVHGTADATVPYTGFTYGVPIDTVLAFWVRNNSCNKTPVQTTVPDINTTDGCTADHFVWSGGKSGSTVELYRINGGAHSWPGSLPVLGVTNQDFSASREIWRFFSQYRLNAATAVANQANLSGLQLRLSPNPAKDVLRIEAEGNGSITITDAAGRVVLQSAQKVVDISSLPSGYFIAEYNSGVAKEIASFVKE